jgi:hypothetical protein
VWAWREIIIPGGVANVRFGGRIVVVLKGNKIKIRFYQELKFKIWLRPAGPSISIAGDFFGGLCLKYAEQAAFDKVKFEIYLVGPLLHSIVITSTRRKNSNSGLLSQKVLHPIRRWMGSG